MKLTPFESSIERVALRILKRNQKEIDKRVNEAYARAVGQAVEFLAAKTSPAVKANKTRKHMKAMHGCLLWLREWLVTSRDVNVCLKPEEVHAAKKAIDDVLHEVQKGGDQ